MRVLADTHVLLWWLADAPDLSTVHRAALADAENEVFFSAVSVAEVAIKVSLGKLEAPDGLQGALTDDGFTELPLTAEHAARLRDLPWHHRDPFDRMLIAQAQCDRLVLATADPRLAAYGVELV